jgi:hypothetical protein
MCCCICPSGPLSTQWLHILRGPGAHGWCVLHTVNTKPCGPELRKSSFTQERQQGIRRLPSQKQNPTWKGLSDYGSACLTPASHLSEPKELCFQVVWPWSLPHSWRGQTVLSEKWPARAIICLINCLWIPSTWWPSFLYLHSGGHRPSVCRAIVGT